MRNFDLFKILGDTAKKILGFEVEDPESPSSGQQGQGQGKQGQQGQEQQGSDPIPSGGKASSEQIARIAKTAGIPEKHIPTMVSIALAESGGNIGARYNPEGNTGEDSYGLWQINMDRYADERLKLFGIDNRNYLILLQTLKRAMKYLNNRGLMLGLFIALVSIETFCLLPKKQQVLALNQPFPEVLILALDTK